VYTIYTQRTCSYCDDAKKLMIEKDIIFMEISIDHDVQARTMLKEEGHKTVPQIFDNENNHIGGFDELKKALTS